MTTLILAPKSSFILDSLEESKEGDPLSQESNTIPVNRVTPKIVNRIMKRLSSTSPGQLAKLESLFDNCKDADEAP